jgi:hypothetical protein
LFDINALLRWLSIHHRAAIAGPEETIMLNLQDTTATTAVATATHELFSGIQPTVRHLVIDDVPTVEVSLSGTHGFDKVMRLDERDWLDVSTRFTPWWSVAKMGGKEYVYSGTAVAAAVARETSKTGMLFLARYIAEPGPRQNVRFRNDDHFDMRRSNLVVVDRRTHSMLNVATRRENDRRREAAKRAAMEAAKQGTTQAAPGAP